MITIKSFYFEPNDFSDKPIEIIVFDKGINLIIGDKTDANLPKMNSVGKSLIVEMINYCFFKEESQRINKIPTEKLGHDILLCLDLELETSKKITAISIKRKRSSTSPIMMIVDGEEKEFEKVEEAQKFFEALIHEGLAPGARPSLRSLLSIFIREEKSAFDDILMPYARTFNTNFSDLIKPHLYLFGIDVDLVKKIKKCKGQIQAIKKAITSTNDNFKNLGINPAEVKSYINDLDDKVQKLDLSIDQLKPSEALKQMEESRSELEAELDKLIIQRAAKKVTAQKIRNLPAIENVNTEKVKIIYEQYREGLGSLVKKSLDEILEFRRKIESFQSELMTSRLETLLSEISKLDTRIQALDREISKTYAATGARQKIWSLEKAVREKTRSSYELEQYRSRYKILEERKSELKQLVKNLESMLDEMGSDLNAIKVGIAQFEDDLKSIHEAITGNTKCQFDIKIENKDRYVEFDYRIDLDGGNGMDRIRTFMYDALLMTSSTTKTRHFGFLIHDNIFPAAGRDDMVQGLNYLDRLSKSGLDFQYIVTLNKDEFDAHEGDFTFNTSEKTKAVFTRDEPFLQTTYRQV